jgi:DNA-binding transcriptional LysR family regulator
MPDLNSLIVFAQVIEANSFSEAARRLQMPASTVSRRIAELEDQLGVRLIERSTRSLRLTDVGAEVLQHARRSAEVSEAVANIASNHQSQVCGTLRISAPPSISDSVLTPLISAFQSTYPNVRFHVFITERILDRIGEGIDLAFRIGPSLKDSSLIARKLLTYRHQLLATPAYLKKHKPPRAPKDLLNHNLLAFSLGSGDYKWTFAHTNKRERPGTRPDIKARQTLAFHPYLAMNDYAGLVPAILAGIGIGELPPIVQPSLSRKTQLIEVMPNWHLPTFDLWLIHLGNRHVPRPVRVFNDFAVKLTPTLFPNLPA